MQILTLQIATAATKIGTFDSGDTLYLSNRAFASDDEEDETAELLRELEKIKKERAEKREIEVSYSVLDTLRIDPDGTIQEREKAEAEQSKREHDIALGNPLLNPTKDVETKRRYSHC